MDPATQGLIGACAVQSTMKDTQREKLWFVAILAGMAADLDVLIRSSNNPLLFIYYHRHFTHALLFIPLGGLIVAAFLMAFKTYRVNPKRVLMAATIAYATHGILDACTSYGTLLYWPFSLERVSFDIISIVDPLFTAPLFFGVVFSAVSEKKIWARVGLGVSLLYLAFAIFQHHKALSEQQQLAQSRGHQLSKARVTPTLGNVFRWRSLYLHQDKIYLDSIMTPLHKASSSQTGIAVPHFTQSQLPSEIRNQASWQRDFEIFNWFADGYVSAFQQQPLLLADMRYLLRRQAPMQSLWGIEFPDSAQRQHVYWRKMVEEGS